jgi:hypothetical protein
MDSFAESQKANGGGVLSGKATFLGASRGGDFVPMDSRRWSEYHEDNEGKLSIVTLEPNARKASDRQRKYYFAVVVPMVAELLESILKEPITENDSHEWLKYKFIGPKVTSLGDIPPTTTTLSVDAMTAYIDKVREYFLHFYGAVIPGPNELHEVA